MDYQQAVDYFFSKLPMFSNQGKKALKPKLDNIRRLIDLLNIDINTVPYIHIAGTNGKGSTCHIIAAAFQEAGYRTGLLTSPHLVDLRERVKINGELVSQDIVLEFAQKVKELKEEVYPSYFEMNVALAFYAFTQLKVDIAVLETGLGGRWDSTNIVTPQLSVITSIDYDHTDILGDTLAKIASEKAGIIKEHVPVVIGKKQEETESVFIQAALSRSSAIFFAEDFFIPVLLGDMPADDGVSQYRYFFEIQNQEKHLLQTDLLGSYQWDNIRTAWTAVRVLNGLGWHVGDSDFKNALKEVKQLTHLRGRWDIYAPNIILDVGHNPEGISAAIDNLLLTGRRYKILYGSVKDKDVEKCVSYLPDEARYFITMAQVPRAMPVNDLGHIFKEKGMRNYSQYDSVSEALPTALKSLAEDEILLITGSFFIVGEAYQYLDAHHRQ